MRKNPSRDTDKSHPSASSLQTLFCEDSAASSSRLAKLEQGTLLFNPFVRVVRDMPSHVQVLVACMPILMLEDLLYDLVPESKSLAVSG